MLAEGDAVLRFVGKRGRHKGGRGKKDRRKRGRAVRTGTVKMIKAAGIRQPHHKGYLV